MVFVTSVESGCESGSAGGGSVMAVVRGVAQGRASLFNLNRARFFPSPLPASFSTLAALTSCCDPAVTFQLAGLGVPSSAGPLEGPRTAALAYFFKSHCGTPELGFPPIAFWAELSELSIPCPSSHLPGTLGLL